MHTLEPTVPAATTFPRQPSPRGWLDAARTACARIAPLWPLQHFVAVNPFLGMTAQPFFEVCGLMDRLVPGGMLMPAPYYLEKLAAGGLDDADLAAALVHAAGTLPPDAVRQIRDWTPARVRAELRCHRPEDGGATWRTVTEAVDLLRGTSWADAVTGAIGQFCAAYYDAGQSAWRLPWRDLPLFQAWREHASLDAGFEVAGLPGFRAWVRTLPDDAESALARLLPGFGLLDEGLDHFLHKQLLTVRGWAGHAQYRVRENGAAGRADDFVLGLLAVRVACDAALLARFDGPALRGLWPGGDEARPSSTPARLIGLLAEEHAWQRRLVAKLAPGGRMPARENPAARPAAQAVFCIDVRSEVFRRALGTVAPQVRTSGFAGFFGLPIEAVPFGERHGVAQCPVLLQPKYRVRETPVGTGARDEPTALRQRRLRRRLTHAWNSFKTSAISCFSFVEVAGLLFGGTLFRRAFAHGKPARPPAKPGLRLAPDERDGSGIPAADRAALALGILRNLGLTRDFARLVLFCGHGSATDNNPYAAGLDCGACGGHAGDPNARLAAAILNDPEVRSALAREGIAIPADTWFLAGLHNTTTDEVTLFDPDLAPATHRGDVAALQCALDAAGERSRRERAALLGLDPQDGRLDARVSARGCDWAQVRPEWGLAGNAAFIAAPRARTQGVDLGGRAFLHDYDHRADAGDRTLELIMSAPMVVANWINLQYFASTVNNAVFGSGNKVLHNVVGTLGVCLGNGGDLQTGLPLQSLHDGKRWVHEPLRLHVLLEAPRARIEAVLARQAGGRELVEHGWLLLFAIEDEGAALHRYLPGERWEPVAWS